MAIVRAIASGNWSNTAIWNTGALPTAADDVYSNSFTVTIDTSPTVLSISNASTTGVTAGGSFVATNGITITCTGNGLLPSNNSTTLLSSTLTAGQSYSVASNVSCASSTLTIGISNTSTGTLNFTGNITGPTFASGASPVGILNSSTGTVNITGNLVGSSVHTSCTLVSNTGSGTITITGSITANNHPGLNNSGGGTVTITGSVTAGVGAPVSNSGSSVVTVIGALNASNSQPAVSSTSVNGTAFLSGPFNTSSQGVNPVYAQKWLWQAASPATYYQVRTISSLALRPLYTADSVGGNPATSNVRSGTVYGPAGELTGTCAVPPADSVALGVPVDATTGTAVLTQANFQAALDAQGLTSSRATKLDNLDDTVSSRLASVSYTAPLDAAGTRTAIGLATANLDSQLDALPTAVENASAVRTVLSPELGRIDVATSTRSTFNPATDTVAQVTLVDTTTNLTNPPDVPTTSEIADAVRIELTPELDRIDADVSSRLAAIDYTTPPTALENAQAVEVQLSLPLGNLDVAVSTRSTFDPATDVVAEVTLVDTTTDLTNPPVVPTPEQIAEAVRTELTPELDRVSNCATVATTGQQIQNALST